VEEVLSGTASLRQSCSSAQLLDAHSLIVEAPIADPADGDNSTDRKLNPFGAAPRDKMDGDIGSAVIIVHALPLTTKIQVPAILVLTCLLFRRFL
jgi:hypothetical protein